MKEVIFLSMIFISALPVMAQESVGNIELEISSYSRGHKFEPLGTSVNNNFVLFYEALGLWIKNIHVRVIEPTGTLGAVNILAEDFDIRRWDAVWHPVVKKFLLVYVKDNEVWARSVKLNGEPGGQSRRVCDYRDDYLQLAWTKKKKFVLFLTRGGQLAAQALKKNGKKFKTEKKLTSFNSGEAYPVAAATKDNREAVAYYAHYVDSTNKLTPRLISVNHKLKIYDYYAITSAQDSDSKATFVGNYDPVSKTHSIAWNFVGAAKKKSHSEYCCFDESGTMVLPPTNTPKNITPTELIYNPSMERFAIGYNKYEYSTPRGGRTAGTYSTCIYLTIYNPNGSIVTKEREVYLENNYAIGTGVGYAKNGSILGVISYTSEKYRSGRTRANLLPFY